MKTSFFLKWSLLCAALLMSVAVQAQCSRPLRLSVYNWPPYSFYATDGAAVGADVEILAAVAKEASCEVEYLPEYNNYKEMLENGDLDVAMGHSFVADRLATTNYAYSYRDEVISLYTKRSLAFKINSFQDILRHKLKLCGAKTGYFGKEYERLRGKLLDNDLLLLDDSTQTVVQYLLEERCDLLMGDNTDITYTTTVLGMDELFRLRFTPNRNRVYLVLSKVSTTTNDLIVMRKAEAKLLADGTIDKILLKYKYIFRDK